MSVVAKRIVKDSTLQLRATFKDLNGDIADPSTITLGVKTAGGVTTNYVYNTATQVVRESLGVFYANIQFNEAGSWYYEWVGTGAVSIVGQRKVIVDEQFV